MDKERISILLVEDDEDDYILTRDLLSEIEGRSYDMEWVSTYDAALEAISLNNHHVYLFDYQLGERTGLELLHKAIADGCKVPIILLTGQGDHKVDLEAMKAGAADYLNKREINADLLERSIRFSITQKKAEARILHMAYYDSLTDLPNRILFQDRLNQTLENAKRYDVISAILFLDLDNFKRINDTLNHRVGDMLLKGIAERLATLVRASDTVAREGMNILSNTVARLGGDEFIILLTEINSLQDAAKVSQRVLNTISKPFNINGYEVFVTASIGITLYPSDGNDLDGLLKNADIAMYHAKDQGKNNFQFYMQSMNVATIDRLTMENSLRKALEREEFLLYYQPRMDILTGKVIGAEALIRWNHPDKGLVYPNEFIPIAEETGFIIPIGEWVLKTACKQNKVWQKSGYSHTRISVSLNLSGHQFNQESLIAIIEKALNNSVLEPQYLELEITESVIMKRGEATVAMLNKLKNMGLTISMDDFGTGYSSFSYLSQFPLDIIKIDRSFISNVTKSSKDAAIVKAIIVMAHTLKLKVVAEGVETEQQLAFLREQGCDEMQGYLLSRPLSVEDFARFMTEIKDNNNCITLSNVKH